jgi:hypothetical protein
MAKKFVLRDHRLVFSRQTTRHRPAGVSGRLTVHVAMPLVTGTPEVTETPHVLPPSTDTSTLAVSLENPPAVQTRGTAPLDTAPAST